MGNPLIDMPTLPPFSRIRPEHVEPAIRQLIEKNRTAIESLLGATGEYTWDNIVQPLELLEDRLSHAWSPVSHMNSVVNSSDLRLAYNACLPLLSEYATELGQNERLFNAFRMVFEDTDASSTEAARHKLLSNAIRDFRLSGVDLEPEKKKRFKEIQQDLSRLASRFEENLLDATNAWVKVVGDAAELEGLPESSIALARQTAEQREESGWLLTLEFPSYHAVMTYAADAGLRREMYEAYVTRASNEGPHGGRWDNTDTMAGILALRHEGAQLLGFANFAEQSLATKMAPSVDKVTGFLQELADRCLPVAKEELAELEQFARETHGVEQLHAWDIAYYSEKLREHRYAVSQEQLKPYFPDQQVIAGMFALVQRLYAIQISPVSDVDTWHPDVRFFEIRDASGEVCAQFYLDLYARSQKRGGAWMDVCVSRLRDAGRSQNPVAYLTCNFSPPIGDDPALLTHDEVITLFHEFGHGLHHMLTRVDYPSIAGINGVAWDAVELPSQFMENWCWERKVLDLISGHYQTGEPLPDDLFDKMRAARNFQAGMQMVRQIEFSLFDFRIHMEYDPDKGNRVYEILSEVRDQVAVIHPPAFNRFAHGFSHIFAGGYAAGYYSYKWAEVLSSDAFSRFEEEGLFNPQTGRAFLRHILEPGGSQDAMDLFREFRGREPSIDALLRHSGIAA